MTSTTHHSNIDTTNLSLTVEKSKSGKDQVKLRNPKTSMPLTAELDGFQILWESASGDGTLGRFNITDPRHANLTMTLCEGLTPSQLAGDEYAEYMKKAFMKQASSIKFLRDVASKTFLWMGANGMIDHKVDEATEMAQKLFPKDKKKQQSYIDDVVIRGGTMPLGTDKETGYTTIKSKKRLCRWAPEGEEAERDSVAVYVYDGVRHTKTDEPLNRGDWVNLTAVINPWVTPSAYGVTLNIKSVQLIRKGPAYSSVAPMSVPDLPPLPCPKAATTGSASDEPAAKRIKSQ